MNANKLRYLGLHTFPGQVVFLTAVSSVGAWGLLKLREDEDSSSIAHSPRAQASAQSGANRILPPSASTSSNSPSSSTATASMSKGDGDMVDIIMSGTRRVFSGSSVSGSGDASRSAAGVGQQAAGGITLSDALTAERGASIWWSYARDNQAVTDRLVSRSSTTTLLVPVDKAIQGMSRKPYQHPGGMFRGALSSSSSNTERFLQAHMIEGQAQSGKLQTMLDGFQVELTKDKSAKSGWRMKAGKGEIEVLGVKETANGRIIYLDEVLPY